MLAALPATSCNRTPSSRPFPFTASMRTSDIVRYCYSKKYSKIIRFDKCTTSAYLDAVAAGAAAAAASAAVSAVCIYYVILGGALRAPIKVHDKIHTACYLQSLLP